LKKAAAEFEQKVSTAEDHIAKTIALLERRVPNTIDGMEQRIESLNMESAAKRTQAVESFSYGVEGRITDLQGQFQETSDKVA
jgi:hypothetical protein